MFRSAPRRGRNAAGSDGFGGYGGYGGYGGFRLLEIRRPSVATAGTVAPSHLLHKFGKLTIEFEMLCKKLKACSFKTSAGQGTADAGACGAVSAAGTRTSGASGGYTER